MKSWISAALQALAEHDRGVEAPEAVEIRLLASFRGRRRQRKLKAAALATLAAAAAIMLFFARPQEPPRELPVPVKAVVEGPFTVAEEPASKPKPTPRRRPIKRMRREIVTEFFPLLDVAPPFERGELLRMTVPASMMRRVGLPVDEDRLDDRVYADVLVGQEGLARAIRFVSYE
jgi:hypothetical protein